MNTNVAKAKILHNLFLNQTGIAKLVKQGIYKDLALSLSLEDLHSLNSNNIYINPIFAPGSTNKLSIDLQANSLMISIDINSLLPFTIKESTAIILHEIGHAFNPNLRGEQGEFAADDYAITRGYLEHIKSSLEKGISLRPELYDTEITKKRLTRINNL